MPCCIDDDCNHNQKQTQTENRHHDDCNNCSPFILCGQCVGFIIPYSGCQINTPQILVNAFFDEYIQLYFPQYFSSLWLPPKIA